MTYTIAVCTVKTPDDGQRNCPKHVGFYSKNKFEKLVHLVGFITRICCVCLMFSAKHNLYFSFFFQEETWCHQCKTAGIPREIPSQVSP